VQIVDVQRDAGVVGEPLKKLERELGVKTADHAALERHTHVQAGAARKIDHHARQRFVQRHISVAVAANAFFVAHRLGKGLAECDAHVFHGVMAVDVQVALGLNVQVNQAVAGDLVEHVVKKADAGGQLGRTRAVEVDAHRDLRLGGVALHLGHALGG